MLLRFLVGQTIIQVENLRKNYGAVEALRGVSFEIAEGEIFGLLGPNGAGKTTTVEILEGMRTADSGSARVCGLDPRAAEDELQQQIGAVLQSTSLPEKLKVSEAIELFAGFYHKRRDLRTLLERLGLAERQDAFYGTLSGGQKQRLALALALVHEPRVLFLDEPTAGLDPQVRREMYEIIAELRGERKTVLLTTHYIEEAERLCDRVAVVDHGRVIALGTPAELKQRSAGHTRITVRLAEPELDGVLKQLDGVAECHRADGAYVLRSSKPPHTIIALVKYLETHGNELQSLEMTSPSLEDVFIELTGRRMRD
ncbi:MAG: ATP-binding cassette domain-containing protein [Candidatus Acidiferrales bacterium]